LQELVTISTCTFTEKRGIKGLQEQLLGMMYCDEAKLLPLLLRQGLVCRVHTIQVEVGPLGGDSFKITLSTADTTVRAAKKEIESIHGTQQGLQELYKVAVRANGGAVREDDAEPEALDDDSQMLKDGQMLTLAVKDNITIRVTDQTGDLTYFKVKVTTVLQQVFNAFAQRKGVDERRLRFLLDGQRISGEQTPELLGLDDYRYAAEHMDQIDCLLEQRGFGNFGAHAGSSGITHLISADKVNDTTDTSRPWENTPAEARSLVRELAGCESAVFSSDPATILLDKAAREVLMRYMDSQHTWQLDLQLELTREELAAMIGGAAAARLAGLFAHDCTEIRLRRAQARDGTAADAFCVNFRIDQMSRTMQVPLNDEGEGEGEYTGGQLIYVNREGFHQPKRPAGSATIHESSIVHGVTPLLRGARYSLFFLRGGSAETTRPGV
jgi:small ubiquitin-related modifier